MAPFKAFRKSAKIRRDEQRVEQFAQNRRFNFDTCIILIYAEFNGGGVRPNDVPNEEESKRCLGDSWSVEKGHHREAEWLKDLKNEVENEDHLQESVVISVEKCRTGKL